MRANPLSLTEEVSQISTSTSSGVFLSNRYVRGTLCFLSQVEWTSRDPDSKEGRISLQRLKFRLVLHLKDEGMSESSVETPEKALGLRLIWTEGITSL